MRLSRARARSDGLGLRRAFPDRMLPSLVAAMAFLAALALAGAIAAHLMAQRWDTGAAAIMTVQVPDPDAACALAGEAATSRVDAVMVQLARIPGIADIHRLGADELQQILRPWLGDQAGIPALKLPAVVRLRLRDHGALPQGLAASLATAAPGTLVEDSSGWGERLLALTTSLQACAGLALLIVAFVAGSVVALATRAGIASRRHAIEIVHGLGATDGYIAGRFARRAGWLALVGGAAGVLAAIPVLGGLSRLASPFAGAASSQIAPGSDTPPDGGSGWAQLLGLATDLPSSLPAALWLGLPALPMVAGAIGWLTAQGTVRVWLRRLL